MTEKEKYELSEIIYQSLTTSFEEKLKTLPPPPEGYYYFPDNPRCHLEGDEYIITMDIILKPIIDK